ncbi:MAG TPA: GGDEF domain-containing protein, partial [Burkholderiaceae bacterium]|nr:GGDEF domain-containing protein [Burkholderiaceae bacterium]
MDVKTLTPSMAAASSADLAKAALRRLVMAKLEPTPENFARAFRAEAGQIGAGGHRAERALALVERLVGAGLPAAEPGRRRALSQALFDGNWDLAERELEAVAQNDTAGAALATLIDRVMRGLERGGRQWTSARRKDSLQRVLA